MKQNILKKLYYSISIIFLFIISLLLVFVITISIKPLKINLLDYFDRESAIFEESNLSEIGDIYLSFDKISKNFEMILEDIVIEDSYIPNLQINLDISFSFNQNLFQPTLKIFDADLVLNITNTNIEIDTTSPLNFEDLFKKVKFLKKFNKIEIINSKLRINSNKYESANFLIDFKYDPKEVSGILSQSVLDDDYLSFKLSKENKKIDSYLNFNNFNLDFLKVFYTNPILSTNDLYISGNSLISLSDPNNFEKIIFDLFVSGKFSYKSFKGEENLNLENTKLFGELIDERIVISFDFPHYSSIFSIGTTFNLRERFKPDIFLKIDQINVENLLKIWPKDLSNSVYYWMNENSRGVINNFFTKINFSSSNESFNLDKLDGKFDYMDVEIRYMESMPSIKMINGNAKINSDSIEFFVKNGKSEKLQIVDGYINLFDLDTDIEKADIDLRIKSKNDDVVSYLDNSPIDKKNFTKLRKISGDTDVKLSLDFPLLLALQAEEIKYNADVKIFNAQINNLIYKITLDKLMLDLKIGNEIVKYSGSAVIDNSIVSFEGNQKSTDNEINDEIKGKINLNGETIHKLTNDFFSDSYGTIPINFSYLNNENNDIKIDAVGDLEGFFTKSDFLGENLNFNNGKLRFLLNPYDEKLSGFFDIKTPNIFIETNFYLNQNRFEKIDLTKFESPIQSFNATIINNNQPKILIKGEKFSLNKIRSNSEENNLFNNIDVILDVNEFVINNKIFTNPEISFSKSNNTFDFLSIELGDQEKSHMISIDNEDFEKIFYLESSDASELFKLFDFDLNTKDGHIKINGKKSNLDKNYNGTIEIDDFVLSDGPFLADFLTLFSLTGLAQKLKGGGIFFESFEGNYIFKEDSVEIKDSLIKGSELGIQFDAKLNLENDDIFAKGSVIPAYTINTLLTKFPIVGDLITAGSPEDGLIGANFEVNTVEGEYDISFNPISVFVPNLIKNFLGD